MTDVAQENKTYVQPVNVAAERAVLSGLCKFGQDIYTDVSEIINVDCFTNNNNQILYKCIDSVLTDSNTIDIPSVIAKATILGYGDIIKDKQNADYIASLFKFNISKENAVNNSRVIRKLEIARKCQKISKEIYIDLSSVNGSESIDGIISKLEKPIFDYTVGLSSESGDKTELVGEGIFDYLKFLEENEQDILGIPSPWPIYNEAIGGGRRRGGVYLTAARPKVGKSSFAINDAIHVAKLGIPVLYLDTEMTKKSQLPRILACMSTQSMKSIETGKYATNEFSKNQVYDSARKIAKIPLYHRPIAGKEFSEIISIIRRWIVQDVGMENGVTKDCLVIYDYFKLMNTSDLDNMKEYQALGYQIQQLSDMCITYDFPCSSYVQMNRDGITKDTTDILSQSDRLLWLCTSLALLKRKTNAEIMTSGSEFGNMKLIVTQEQRFGPGLDEGDWINVAFDKEKCQIKELTSNNNTIQAQRNGFPQITDSVGVLDDGIKESDEDEDGFSDDDFDKFQKQYRDDSIRKY